MTPRTINCALVYSNALRLHYVDNRNAYVRLVPKFAPSHAERVNARDELMVLPGARDLASLEAGGLDEVPTELGEVSLGHLVECETNSSH